MLAYYSSEFDPFPFHFFSQFCWYGTAMTMLLVRQMPLNPLFKVCIDRHAVFFVPGTVDRIYCLCHRVSKIVKNRQLMQRRCVNKLLYESEVYRTH